MWLALPLAVRISDYIKIYWTLSLLESSHYSIFLLYHLIMHCRDVALTWMAEEAHAPPFACVLYIRQLDGSPWRWTLLVIRTQMALQWLIIDAANMWQLLINTHAGWMVQTRTALTIHWGGKGEKAREDEKRRRRKLYIKSQSMCPYTVWHPRGLDDSDELSQ